MLCHRGATYTRAPRRLILGTATYFHPPRSSSHGWKTRSIVPGPIITAASGLRTSFTRFFYKKYQLIDRFRHVLTRFYSYQGGFYFHWRACWPVSCFEELVSIYVIASQNLHWGRIISEVISGVIVLLIIFVNNSDF